MDEKLKQNLLIGGVVFVIALALVFIVRQASAPRETIQNNARPRAAGQAATGDNPGKF